MRDDTAAIKKKISALPIMLRRNTKNLSRFGTLQMTFLTEQFARRIRSIITTMPRDLKKPN